MYTVLPGPEEALPPVEPKFTAIWRKHSAISKFEKILYFSAIFWYFPNR
jgi:cell division protein FtsL